MQNITLTDEDILRVTVIDIDGNVNDALNFIRERILPELKRQDALKMRGHLDGGKGSLF